MWRIRVREVFKSDFFETQESVNPDRLGLVSDQDVQFKDPFSMQFKTELTDNIALFFGDAAGKATLKCSRCLVDFNSQIKVRWDLSVDERQEWAEVGKEIREQVILALPIKPLCHQNCKGLCPSCGSSRNIGSCACRYSKNTHT